jgi:microcystin-dependent protein
MNNVSFNKTGGVPISATLMAFLQAAHADLINGIGAMAGDLAILSGCTETGSQVSDGFVQIGNETFAFVGGTKQANVVIIETKQSAVFENGETKDVLSTRYATFGSGTTVYPWANFTRIEPLKTAQRALVRIDSIMIWGGGIDNIPEGWYLCDGQNGTLDLRGMFIVGYNSNDADYNETGKTGGAKQVTLTTNQMPAHTHTQVAHSHSYEDGYMLENYPNGTAISGKLNIGSQKTGSGSWDNDNNLLYYRDANTKSATPTINNTGGGAPHENRPPYRVVVFIQFKG